MWRCSEALQHYSRSEQRQLLQCKGAVAANRCSAHLQSAAEPCRTAHPTPPLVLIARAAGQSASSLLAVGLLLCIMPVQGFRNCMQHDLHHHTHHHLHHHLRHHVFTHCSDSASSTTSNMSCLLGRLARLQLQVILQGLFPAAVEAT